MEVLAFFFTLNILDILGVQMYLYKKIPNILCLSSHINPNYKHKKCCVEIEYVAENGREIVYVNLCV